MLAVGCSSTPFTAIVAFWENYCTQLMNLVVGGPVGVGSVFLVGGKKKKLDHFESLHVLDLLLNFCSDINGANERKFLL